MSTILLSFSIKRYCFEYLKENNLKIFFTVLGEKIIINPGGIDSKTQTFSGIYSVNDNGDINGMILNLTQNVILKN